MDSYQTIKKNRGLLGALKSKLCFDVNSHLDKVTPDLMLFSIFKCYRTLIKILGLSPIQISERSGKAQLTLCSFATLWSTFNLMMFLSDSWIFIPMFVHLAKEKGRFEGPLINHVVQLLLVTCQYLGAVVSYLVLPVLAPRFVIFWNTLQSVTSRIVQLTSKGHFASIYVSTRWNLKFWLLSSLSFSLFCAYSYGEGFDVYMGKERAEVYWFYYLGFCCFPFMISWHLLHSMAFTSFTNMLVVNFTTLEGHCRVVTPHRENIQSVIEIYDQLNALTAEIGHIFGLYLILELLIMMICISVNVFFLISNLHHLNWGLFVYLAIIIPYLAWFHWICTTGQNLAIQGFKTQKAVKRLLNCQHLEEKKERWIVEPPSALTARYYFSIDMKLFITVIGTITTYLIVMLQFKVSSPSGELHNCGNCCSQNVTE